jgi:predicted TIM-barrel fold metal-dependent hydrolase
VKSRPDLLPLAVCQPKTGSIDKIKQLFEENPDKFIGLKFHPDGHELIASDVKYEPYLKFAQKEKLPCLFHCGIGWDGDRLVEESRRYSSPEAIYQAAKKIPDTPVILAHLGAGGPVVHKKAISVLLESLKNNDAKLYADISWVDCDTKEKPTIVGSIKDLKERHALDRLLFGTDAPIGEFETLKEYGGPVFYSNLVAEIKNAIKNDRNLSSDANDIIDKLFYRNAEALFLKAVLV